MSESDAGVSHKIVLGAGRQAYLVCIEGGLTIGAPDGEVTLDQRDAVELVAPKKGAGALRVLVCSACGSISIHISFGSRHSRGIIIAHRMCEWFLVYCAGLHLDLVARDAGAHFMLMEMTSTPKTGGW